MNDLELPLNDAGVWHMGLVVIPLCNFDSGPWGGAKGWRGVVEGALQSTSARPRLNATCSLYGCVGSRKRSLTGEVQLAMNEGLLAVHAIMVHAVRWKMPKVGASRRFGSIRDETLHHMPLLDACAWECAANDL